MAIIEHSSMPFRPYARLMNVIGDQLITDKKVAVIEIIKNSYDADASVVKVRFCNMSNVGYNGLPKEEQAYIEIEDEELWSRSADTEINRKWWDFMADIMETNPDNSPVSIDLKPVFHLD